MAVAPDNPYRKGEDSMLKMRSLVNAVAMTVLAMAGVFSAHAGTMVSITSPIPGTTVQGTATAKIHLTAPADPSTLRVQENGVDVTKDFNISSCSAAPCDISATLTTGNGQIISGWNYLYATVQTTQGTADFAHMKFKHSVGVSDSTDGSGPPYAVHIWTQTLLGTNSAVSFNLSYSPGSTDGTSYPISGQVCDAGVEIYILNRGTPTPQDSSPAPLSLSSFKCVSVGDNATLQTVLKAATRDQMVLAANLPGTALGGMDFSPVGGTNFAVLATICAVDPKSPACVKPYGYTLIGYGQSATGTAYESFNTNAQAAYAAIDGNLVNAVSSATVYAFQPTRSQGFTIVSALNAGGKSQILVGNMSDQAANDISGDEGKYRVIPAGATTSTAYTPPGDLATGLWLLVLNRHTLALTLSKTYDTNNQTNPVTFCNQLIDLTSDIQAQDSSSLVFLSSIGTPLANWGMLCNTQEQNLMNAVASLGASPYALMQLSADSFGVTAGGAISLVGIPGNAPARSSAAIGSYAPAHKWWSSTREAQVCSAWVWDDKTNDHPPSVTPCTTNASEVGSLRGILAIDHSMQYQPTAVTPFDPSAVAPDNTSDELLNQTASYSIGSASIVPWPMTDTPGHLAAYAYLSSLIIAKQIYGSNPCSTNNVCNDVRFYYTGSQAASLANFDPRVFAYPGDGNGFSSSDYGDVASELHDELSYLENVQNYKAIVENATIQQEISVGLALSNAAQQVATGVGGGLAMAPQPIGESNIQLATDIFNTSAALASIVPGAGELAGVLWSVSGSLQTLNDATNTNEGGDPYVARFADLLSNSGNEGSAAAQKFNNDLTNSTGTFFDGVYSDWYKLQTLGILTRSSSATGWYFQDAGKALNSSYFSAVQVNETGNLVEQLVAQDVQLVRGNQASTENYIQQGSTQEDVDYTVAWGLQTKQYNIVTGSAFGRRTSLGFTGCQDYVYPVFTNTKTMLSSTLWSTIVGLSVGTSDSPAPGLSANFLYDGVLPTAQMFGVNGGCDLIGTTKQYPTSTNLTTSATSVGNGQQVSLEIAIKSLDTSATADLTAPLLVRVNGKSVAVLQIPSGSGDNTIVNYAMDPAVLSPGANNVQVNFLGNASYQPSSSSATINVGTPSFALTAEDAVLDLLSTPGSTIGTDVTLTPDFGFNAPVQLSCSGLPANMSCSFDKSQITVNGTPASAHVTFTNNGTAQAALDTKQIPGRGLGVLACGLVGLCFIRRRSRLVMLVGLLMIGSFLGGCGSSPSVQNPPTGSYAVDVKATGGGITQTTKVVLNIQ
jgi:hypothetical protein